MQGKRAPNWLPEVGLWEGVDPTQEHIPPDEGRPVHQPACGRRLSFLRAQQWFPYVTG